MEVVALLEDMNPEVVAEGKLVVFKLLVVLVQLLKTNLIHSLSNIRVTFA